MCDDRGPAGPLVSGSSPSVAGHKRGALPVMRERKKKKKKENREENRRKRCKVRKGGMVPCSKTQGAG